MKNYRMLIKEIVLSRLNISHSDWEQIVEIKFIESGIHVYYEYWWGRDLLESNDIIFNSEINAFIFETILNK